MHTIFITGASSGLGKAAAKLFQSKGWRVIATMRVPEKESELSQLKNVHLLPLDVTNETQILNTFQKAIAIAQIDVVFNNAGYGLVGPFESYSLAQITRQIDTNLIGVLRVAHPFVKYFRENSIKGIFITTTSIVGIVANPLASVYDATKFALEGWSEGMGYDLASFGIRFKTVAPGGIKTNFASSAMDKVEHPAYQPLFEKMVAGFADGSLMQFTPAEDIAQVVYEAATDDKEQMRYAAGPDAIDAYQKREQLGLEKHRKLVIEMYK